MNHLRQMKLILIHPVLHNYLAIQLNFSLNLSHWITTFEPYEFFLLVSLLTIRVI